MLVPVILLGGLLFGSYKLGSFLPRDRACAIGTCPLAIHPEDSGKTFTYNVGARFSLYIGEKREIPRLIRCIPDGILQPLEEMPAEVLPLYTARFETRAAGTCLLADKGFSATIAIQ